MSGSVKKFIIWWDAGYGRSYDIIDDDTQEGARKAAYEAWRDEAEGYSDYGAMPWTPELEEKADMGDGLTDDGGST